MKTISNYQTVDKLSIHQSFLAMREEISAASIGIAITNKLSSKLHYTDQYCEFYIDETTFEVKGYFRLCSRKRIKVDSIKPKRLDELRLSSDANCHSLLRDLYNFKKVLNEFIAKSRQLSRLLRHQPELKNLTVDTQGWSNISTLVSNTNINRATLDLIVISDDKTRYAIDHSHNVIRALQGHSLPYVSIAMKTAEQPEKLYHGTSPEAARLILECGEIRPMSRNEVHLSQDLATAKKVGTRKCKNGESPVVFVIKKRIDTLKVSENNVFLSERIISIDSSIQIIRD